MCLSHRNRLPCQEMVERPQERRTLLRGPQWLDPPPRPCGRGRGRSEGGAGQGGSGPGRPARVSADAPRLEGRERAARRAWTSLPLQLRMKCRGRRRVGIGHRTETERRSQRSPRFPGRRVVLEPQTA